MRVGVRATRWRQDWNVDELIIPDEQNLLPREFEIDATARSAPTFRPG